MTETTLTLTTPDNIALAATSFAPEQSSGRVVLINSAMGVKRRYYAKYAAFLAEQGFHVLTYDYRGVGDSQHGPLRKNRARLRDWGVVDQGTALAWLVAAYPEHALLVVGHSLGGQIAGLTPHAGRIRGLMGIASQSGYWRYWTGAWRVRVALLWFGIVPVLCPLIGYLPGRVLGSGEHVPAGVALDWASSGRRPNYILSLFGNTPDDYYASVKCPVRLYGFEDDMFAPRPTVEALLDFFPAAPREHRHILPQTIGVPAIGHFGFFRSAMASSLWIETANWLKEVSAS